MAYTITITKTETVTRKVGKEWKVIGQDPDQTDVYGYTPEIEKEVETETKILEQTVVDLDLHAVIKAINGL